MPNHSSSNSKSSSQTHLQPVSPILEVSPLIMSDEFYSGKKLQQQQNRRIVDNQSYTPTRSKTSSSHNSNNNNIQIAPQYRDNRAGNRGLTPRLGSQPPKFLPNGQNIRSNGHSNGHLNGHLSGPLNGHLNGRHQQRPQSRTHPDHDFPEKINTSQVPLIEHQNFGAGSRHQKYSPSKKQVYYFTPGHKILIWSKMIFYLAVLVADGVTSYFYYKYNEKIWFLLTLIFAIAGTLITTLISLRWHLLDFEVLDFGVSFFHFFQLAPVYRMFRLTKCGINLNRTPNEVNFEIFKAEEADISVINLMHSFTVSAPQLTLQLFIVWRVLFGDGSEETVEINKNIQSSTWSVFRNVPESSWPLLYVAFISASFACVNTLITLWQYILTLAKNQNWKSAQKLVQSKKQRILHFIEIVQLVLGYGGLFVGRAFVIVILFVVLESYYYIGIILIAAHWFICWILLLNQNTKYTNSRIEEVFFCAICAWIYVFMFFSLNPKRVKFRVLSYYFLCFLENIAVLIAWFYVSSDRCEEWGETREELQKPKFEWSEENFALFEDSFSSCEKAFKGIVISMTIVNVVGMALNISYYSLRFCRAKFGKDDDKLVVVGAENSEKSDDRVNQRQNRAQMTGAQLGSRDNLLQNVQNSKTAQLFQKTPQNPQNPQNHVQKHLQKEVSLAHQNKLRRGVSGTTNMSSVYDVGTTDRMKIFINDQHKRTFTAENLSRFEMDASKFGAGTATKEKLLNPDDAIDGASVHMSTVRDFHSLSRMNRSLDSKLKRRDSYRGKKNERNGEVGGSRYPPGTIVGGVTQETNHNKRRPLVHNERTHVINTHTTERGRKFTFTKNTDL